MKVSRALTHNGDKLPSADELNQVKNATTFSAFDLGTGLKSGKGLMDLHGEVHVWVGGDMANPATSPNDPLFFLHHAFVDKVFSDWQAVHHPSLFPSEYRDVVMAPWDVKVEDVLSISRLGYAYG
jgi:hypothetical protein